MRKYIDMAICNCRHARSRIIYNVCVRVCVRARARACVYVCVCYKIMKLCHNYDRSVKRLRVFCLFCPFPFTFFIALFPLCIHCSMRTHHAYRRP